MVYPGIYTSDIDPINITTDSHFDRCLGTIKEDCSHGRISWEPERDQTPNRCKFGATTRQNINAHREDSRIDDT
jgi:hypothetical protein